MWVVGTARGSVQTARSVGARRFAQPADVAARNQASGKPELPRRVVQPTARTRGTGCHLAGTHVYVDAYAHTHTHTGGLVLIVSDS